MAIEQKVELNTVVEYEHRYWIVGMINACRARLDPLSAKAVNELEGHTFKSYGDSVNIAPTALLPTHDPSELPDDVFNRYLRLLGKASMETKPKVASMSEFTSDEEEAAMAAKVASQPGVRGRGKKAAAAPKRERSGRPCACGCGQTTGGGFFVPGHDSKFKGQLLRIERGEVAPEKSDIPKRVRDQYKWVKKGEGFIPTTNYKGEPHKGYLKA